MNVVTSEQNEIHLGVGDEETEYGGEMKEMTRKKYIRLDMRERESDQ